MEKIFHYQSDDYERQAQRFVLPLFIKDELGNYKQSSTGTFVKYNEIHHYVIFAAHALDNGCDVNDVYFMTPDGTFIQLVENAFGYKIFGEDDIVLVDFLNVSFSHKNYFNLNVINECSVPDFFCWTGFPLSQSKAKEVHHTKKPESLKKSMVHKDESGHYFTKIKYLTVISPRISFDEKYLIGKYAERNVSFKYKGNVVNPPSLGGMSGGAMYFTNAEYELKDNLDDTFIFAAIGIELKRDNSIIGVSRDRIIELIDSYNESSPISLSMSFLP